MNSLFCAPMLIYIDDLDKQQFNQIFHLLTNRLLLIQNHLYPVIDPSIYLPFHSSIHPSTHPVIYITAEDDTFIRQSTKLGSDNCLHFVYTSKYTVGKINY